MSSEELSLRWQDHHEALLSVFENLLRSNTLVDCTIAAEGRYLKAHKVVLSACSPYFQLLFQEEGEKHPIIILKDVKFWTLKAVIDFVYCGEVKIRENQLGAFLEVAENLQIKGLGSDRQDDSDKEMTPNSPEPVRNSSSPTPRKRIRRNRQSVSDGDNDANDNSRNSHFRRSPLSSSHLTEVPAASSAAVISAPAVSTMSNSNSGSSDTRTNGGRFETNRSSKSGLPSAVSQSQDDQTVIKVEPDTESYHEAKMEYPDEANEDFMEDTAMVGDMDPKSLHDQNSSQHNYSGFGQYGELDSQNPFIPEHHTSQDLPSSNVETIDLSSEESSSFHLSQRDRSNPEGTAGHRDQQLIPADGAPKPGPSSEMFLGNGASSLAFTAPTRPKKKLRPHCRKALGQRHLPSHTFQLKCSKCRCFFKQTYLLRVHQIFDCAASSRHEDPPSLFRPPQGPSEHDGDVCLQCGNTFGYIATSTYTRPYRCASCGICFNDLHFLRIHLSNYHSAGPN